MYTMCMKKLFLFSIIAFGIIACSSEQNDQSAIKLEASKASHIKKGEPVTFLMPDSTAGANISWEVTPSSTAVITPENSGNKKISVVFSKAGNYVVSSKSNLFSSKVSVNVIDSMYVPSKKSIPSIPVLGTGSTVTPSLDSLKTTAK